jgi:hypothetical protein
LDPGKLLDQEPVVAIGGGIWPSPGQTRNRLPRLIDRVSFVPYQVGGMGQAGAMMSRDTMEENRLPVGVSQQISRQGHLLGSRS